MPSYIIKLTRGDESRYLEWSTIVDAPVTYGMTLEQFMRWYKDQFGAKDFKEVLPERLTRVEAKGTSSLGWTLEEVLSSNRAGPNETHLTYDQIWDEYCTKDGA